MIRRMSHWADRTKDESGYIDQTMLLWKVDGHSSNTAGLFPSDLKSQKNVGFNRMLYYYYI